MVLLHSIVFGKRETNAHRCEYAAKAWTFAMFMHVHTSTQLCAKRPSYVPPAAPSLRYNNNELISGKMAHRLAQTIGTTIHSIWLYITYYSTLLVQRCLIKFYLQQTNDGDGARENRCTPSTSRRTNCQLIVHCVFDGVRACIRAVRQGRSLCAQDKCQQSMRRQKRISHTATRPYPQRNLPIHSHTQTCKRASGMIVWPPECQEALRTLDGRCLERQTHTVHITQQASDMHISNELINVCQKRKCECMHVLSLYQHTLRFDKHTRRSTNTQSRTF